MKKTIMWSALAAAVAVGPAFAQSTGTPGQSGTSGQSGSQTDPDRTGSDQSGTPSGTHSGTQSGMQSSGASQDLASSDRKFIEEAARDNMAEIQLAELAKEKASSEEVKRFADHMLTDHKKAGDELKSVASQKGVTVPVEMAGKHKQLHERLEGMSGAEFDRAFMKEMVKQHKKDVEKFEKASRDAKDEAVKQFASKTLPTLQQHHQHAQQIAQTVDQGGTTAGASADRDQDDDKSKDKDKRPAGDDPPPQR